MSSGHGDLEREVQEGSRDWASALSLAARRIKQPKAGRRAQQELRGDAAALGGPEDLGGLWAWLWSPAVVVSEEAGKLSSQGGFPSPAPLCVVTSIYRTYGVQEAPFLGEIPANSQHIRVSYF